MVVADFPLYSRYSPKGGRTPPRSFGSRQSLFYGVFCPVFTMMADTQDIDRLAVLQDRVNDHMSLRGIHAHGWRDLLPQTGDLGIFGYGLKGFFELAFVALGLRQPVFLDTIEENP